MTDDQAALARFSGTARLFPLPNLVFFPQVVQALHIFEPRYRRMMADALDGDQLITLVALQDDADFDADDPPPVEPVGCLGRITHHEKLPDGRYNLRLRGIARVRLVEELPTDKPYRLARAEPLADVIPAELKRLTALRRKLAEAVLPRFEPSGPAHQHLAELFQGEMPLGVLCDMLAYALPLDQELKQTLLGEPHVTLRADLLMHALRQAGGADDDEDAPPGRRFPARLQRELVECRANPSGAFQPWRSGKARSRSKAARSPSTARN